LTALPDLKIACRALVDGYDGHRIVLFGARMKLIAGIVAGFGSVILLCRAAPAADQAPISLHVNNVPARAAFERLFGDLSLKASEGDNPLWDKFEFSPVTLNVDKQPLWEVMRQLNRMTGVAFGGVQGDRVMLFMDHGTFSRQPGVVAGPLWVSAQGVELRQAVMLSKTHRETEDFTLSVQVIADPRSHAVLLEVGDPDQVGQAEPALPPSQRQPNTIELTGSRTGFGVPIQRTNPSQPTEDVHLKLTVWSVTLSSPLSITIAGGGTHVQKDFGKFNGTMAYHPTSQGYGAVDLTLTNTGLNPVEWRGLASCIGGSPPVLSDAQGNEYRRGGGGGNSNNGRISRTVQFGAAPRDTALGEPQQVVWNIPVTMASDTFDVVLKDLQLP
jgi:hypothetical protein